MEEKLACAKRLLHKVHELVEGEGHLLAIDKLKSVQGHVEERIVVLQALLASLSGGGRDGPSEPSDVFSRMAAIGGAFANQTLARTRLLYKPRGGQS